MTGERASVAALKWPAAVVTAALVATGLGDAVGIVVDVKRDDLLKRIQSGAFVSVSEANASDHRQAVIALIQGALFAVTAIAFIWWFRRAYGNVDALGGKRRFGLGWAIGGWFVPILAFWRPKQIANDLWLGSDPDYPEERESLSGVSPLVTWWWGLFIVSAWLGGRVLASQGDAAHEMRATTILVFVADGLDIVAACLAVGVVLSLTSRQRERAERRAALVAVTGRELDAELDYADTESPDEDDVTESFTCDASAESIRHQRELGYSHCKLCGRPLDRHEASQPS